MRLSLEVEPQSRSGAKSTSGLDQDEIEDEERKRIMSGIMASLSWPRCWGHGRSFVFKHHADGNSPIGREALS
ncbi:hypothetical protein EVAR_50104_1 [Eumeta japonica]|uniref:Uncharacterized protein n=1 Tax=Eumeta variegata TaxID=151549 RepID=A0A4C1XX52_EUMVA|nr:hypothetical protein EVAR_50104_1 [Eumeta japonica]